MRFLSAIVLVFLTSGCSFAPDCYVGVSLIPPGPFVHCGIDGSPDDEEEGAE